MTYPQTKLPSFTPRFPPCPPSPSVTSCPPPYLYVISCLLSLRPCHFLSSLLRSVTSCLLSLLLCHFQATSLLHVTSCPFGLLLHPFLSPLPTSMSLPVSTSTSLPAPFPYVDVTSCPLSLRLCHFLSPSLCQLVRLTALL